MVLADLRAEYGSCVETTQCPGVEPTQRPCVEPTQCPIGAHTVSLWSPHSVTVAITQCSLVGITQNSVAGGARTLPRLLPSLTSQVETALQRCPAAPQTHPVAPGPAAQKQEQLC